MRVFVSWSGSETKLIAETIKLWLPRILLNRVDVFVSSQDIAKGERGLNVIAESLNDIDFGLVVLTKANEGAKWINFEAGALGKLLGKSLVSPLLVDLTEADVSGPLAQFQMTKLTDVEDVWKLICDINNTFDDPLPEESVRVLFDNSWESLASVVTKAGKLAGATKTTRPRDEILDEILYRVRQLERPRASVHDPARHDSELDQRKISSALIPYLDFSKHPDIRVRFTTGKLGPVAHITIPEEAAFDFVGLQAVADANDVRILLSGPDVAIEPRGRYRDPVVDRILSDVGSTTVKDIATMRLQE